jgi:hypothetical protein
MRLTRARVQHFKSIADSGLVTVEPTVTVLVGQNEAGKTAFLQALHKARPADEGAEYDRESDYPRVALNDYDELHPDSPAVVATLTYELSADELRTINEAYGTEVLTNPLVTFTHHYKNGYGIGLHVDELRYTHHLVAQAKLPEEVAQTLKNARNARDLLTVLGAATRGPEAEAFYAELTKHFGTLPAGWSGIGYEIWTEYVKPAVPQFVYFDDYRLLPGRMNLTGLQQRVAQSKSTPLCSPARTARCSGCCGWRRST